MTKAIYSSTFKVIDKKHINLIKKSSQSYDQLFVVVVNDDKGNNQSPIKERFNSLKELELPKNTMVLMLPKGLLTTMARQMHIDILIRGYETDEELLFEEELAKENRKQQSHIKTNILKLV